MLDDCVFFQRTKQWSPEYTEKQIDDLYNHRLKQRRFARYRYPEAGYRLWADAESGTQETRKQDSVYVGLPRMGRRIDFSGRIKNPASVSRRQAELQISRLGDFLIDLVAGVVSDRYILDSEAAQAVCDTELLTRLAEFWPPRGRSVKELYALTISAPTRAD